MRIRFYALELNAGSPAGQLMKNSTHHSLRINEWPLNQPHKDRRYSA